MKQAVSRRSSQRESFWRTQIQDQQASGLSIREFCRQRQLRDPSFYQWRRTLAARDGNPARRADTQRGSRAKPNRTTKAPSASALVPVVLGANGSSRIEIVLTGGTTLRLSEPVDAAQLKQVLEVLRQHEAESAK